MISGPLATTILADQGAEVVKVEAPGTGDNARYVGSARHGMSGIFLACNRGKRAITLNLADERGKEILHALFATADVVVQNFRPGVVDRMGVGYDDARRIRPDIVYVSISGFGEAGPYAHKKVYDNVIQAYSGMAAVQSDPTTGEPSVVRNLVADKLASQTAAQAITAALFARDRGAGGQHVTLSMLDSVIAFLWPDAGVNQMLLEHEGADIKEPPGRQLRYVRFADGWGTATPLSDAEFEGACRALDLPAEITDDPLLATVTDRMANFARFAEALEAIGRAVATLTAAEAVARLEAEGVPCSVVLSLDELPANVQVVANGTFVETEHPVAGRLRETAPRRGSPGPLPRSAAPRPRPASTPTRSSPSSGSATGWPSCAPPAPSPDRPSPITDRFGVVAGDITAPGDAKTDLAEGDLGELVADGAVVVEDGVGLAGLAALHQVGHGRRDDVGVHERAAGLDDGAAPTRRVE